MENLKKLLDDVIDAKVSAMLAERDGDICDDTQHQEELDATAAKLCQILKDQNKQKWELSEWRLGAECKKEKKNKGKGK